jgi:glycosyltransferase involved in cell wall biosynthesis
MNILFIVPYTPNLIHVRPYQLIRSLVRRGHRLTLATLWISDEEQADLDRLAAEGVQVLACWLSIWRSTWNCLRALPSGVPLQAVYCWQPALARRVQFAIRHSQFDIIHVEHLRGARYGLHTKSEIRNPKSEIPIVWDSVDCISYLFEQAARDSRSLKGRLMTRLELGRTRRHEGWLVGQFDRVLVTSEVDATALRELAAVSCPLSVGQQSAISNQQLTTSNEQLITVLPNGVDLAYFTPTGEPREPASVVITGKMSYHANVTAALHLIQDIMPRVWAQRPDVQVWIAGKDPPREIRALGTYGGQSSVIGGRVTVTGTVPDIRPYLRRATLAVAPVPYGAGIQNKVLEAMACETPVVASPQAISALAARPGRDLVVAGGAEAFAQAVLALLDDPARRAQLGPAGRAYVEAHHNWEVIAAQLEDIYWNSIATRDNV